MKKNVAKGFLTYFGKAMHTLVQAAFFPLEDFALSPQN